MDLMEGMSSSGQHPGKMVSPESSLEIFLRTSVKAKWQGCFPGCFRMGGMFEIGRVNLR